MSAFGIKYVETAGTYGVSPESFRTLLDERGLKAVSGHFPYEKCRDNVDSIAAEAKTLGLEYVGVPGFLTSIRSTKRHVATPLRSLIEPARRWPNMV